MNYLTLGLGIALIVSALCNFALYDDLQETRDAKAVAETTSSTNVETAKLCSKSTDRLMEEARADALTNAPKIEAAEAEAKVVTKTAYVYLQSPPSDPTNLCKSSADFIRGVLKDKQ